MHVYNCEYPHKMSRNVRMLNAPLCLYSFFVSVILLSIVEIAYGSGLCQGPLN